MDGFAAVNWAAVLLGCIIISVFLYWDFEVPYNHGTIRYGVAFRRYVLALCVYIAGYLLVFLLLVGLLQRAFTWVWPLVMQLWPPTDRPWKANLTVIFEGGSQYGARQISLVASLLITILLPYLPASRSAVKLFRRFVHFIALYPQSIQLVIAMIARAEFKHSVDPTTTIQRELDAYCVPKGALVKALSVNAVQLMEEGLALRSQFAKLKLEHPFTKFIAARASDLVGLERELQRVIQRVARALLNTQLDKHQSNIISQFAAEDCQTIILKYRELIAEATWSCVSNPWAREKLIDDFGYSVSFPPAIPFVPLIVVFGLDFIMLLWPLALSPWVSLPVPINPAFITGFALAHAISFTAATVWAIYPLARRKFSSGRWGTVLPVYVTLGLFAYCTGALVFTLMRLIISPNPTMPLATHPAFFIAINSVQFLALTICIAALTDVRMRADSMDYNRYRWRDGILTTALMTLCAVGFQLSLLPIMPKDFKFGLWFAIYLGITFAVSFIIGFFLPAVAAAHLRIKEVVSKQMLSEMEVLDRVKRRKAQAIASQSSSSARPDRLVGVNVT
jgi:hypothetical protein